MMPGEHQAGHGRRDMDRKVDATESTKDRVRRDDRGEVDQEECLKRTEKLYIRYEARESEMPGRRRRKTLPTCAESMHVCDQHEQC